MRTDKPKYVVLLSCFETGALWYTDCADTYQEALGIVYYQLEKFIDEIKTAHLDRLLKEAEYYREKGEKDKADECVEKYREDGREDGTFGIPKLIEGEGGWSITASIYDDYMTYTILEKENWDEEDKDGSEEG